MSCFKTRYMNVQRYYLRLLLLVTVMLALTAAPTHGDILYDNLNSPIGKGCGGSYANSAGAEVIVGEDEPYARAAIGLPANTFYVSSNIKIGKSVRLPGQNPIALADFALKYYGLNFSGNEQARLRFYGPGAAWYV